MILFLFFITLMIATAQMILITDDTAMIAGILEGMLIIPLAVNVEIKFDVLWNTMHGMIEFVLYLRNAIANPIIVAHTAQRSEPL